MRGFAKRMQVHESTVRDRIKNGRLAEAVHPDGSLEEEVAERLWVENADIARRKRVLTPPRNRKARIAEKAEEGADAYAVKVERMRVALKSEMLKLEQLRGTTVDRGEVRRAARAYGKALRDPMLAFAARFGPSIAAAAGCDPATLIAAIDARMHDALRETLPLPVEADSEGKK